MIKELEFKGKTFKIEYVETYATHPTWYSFEDEKDVREAFWNPKEGEVVLDVGACCGSYSLPALAHGAIVIAWAPGRLMEGTLESDILHRNVVANGWLDAGNNRILTFGLYDAQGFLNVDTQVFRAEQHGLIVTCDPPEIPVVTLDDGYTFTGGVDWLKIDVEGAELNVLKGARETLKKFHPKILVECHLFVRRSMLHEVANFLIGEIGGYVLEKPPIAHSASDVVHALFEPV